ncbi:MAG: InlB B-repeat-containing protein, partial [Treponema sp.]|nr:InlB B-repeat-containing protein [Treponema sp.]
MKTNSLYEKISVLPPFSPHTLSSFLLLLPILLLGLAACAPPVNNMEGGNLTIVLSQGNEGRAVGPEILEKLVYDMRFSGPGRASISLVTDPGVQYVTVSVIPGNWTVSVKASLEGELFGTGELAFRVGNGGSNSVMIPMRRSAAEITGFSCKEATGVVDRAERTVTVTVPHGMPLTSLVPAITVSPGASIEPASGVERDFTNPVTYTITAANKSTATWTVTVKAASAADTVTVTFNAGGGTPAPAAQTVAEGGTITAPPAMTKAGYSFDGWYREAALTTPWNFSTDTVTADITLSARWNAVGAGYRAVTWELNNGSWPGATTPMNQVEVDGKITRPSDPARSGFTFTGWYREAALTTPWNFGTDTVTMDITLYAKWNAITYTVTFNANGGIPTPAAQTVTGGSAITAPP